MKEKRFKIKGKIIWDEDDPSAYTMKELNVLATSMKEAKKKFADLIQPKAILGPTANFKVETYDENCYEIKD